MKKAPIRYRNICLAQWVALVLSQIIYSITSSSVFYIIRSSLILCVVISIIKYRYMMDKYIELGDYKKLVKYQVENGCYKVAKPIGEIKGIVIMCTQYDEPYLKRYVDSHNELGFNFEKNHWNVPSNAKMPHDFIGYDKNDEIVIINTLSYATSSLACGKGNKGSCDISYLKLNICFKSDDKIYFENAVYGAAVQHCAYLCKKHKLKPNCIFSDKEVFDLGFANNYTFLEEWMLTYGKTMEDFRKSVKERLKGK